MADIDPDNWTIVDGKLYLNLNEKVQKMWLKDKENFIQQADSNWPGVLNR